MLLDFGIALLISVGLTFWVWLIMEICADAFASEPEPVETTLPVRSIDYSWMRAPAPWATGKRSPYGKDSLLWAT